MKLKKIIKDIAPPIIFRLARKVFKKRGGMYFEGNYSSWDQAVEFLGAQGYADPSILEKTLKSTLMVKNGNAVFERDSVIFDQIQYSWPLLAGILLAAARSEGVYRILDFGGAFGSTYFQNKRFFNLLNKKILYGIVEQNHYIDVGNKYLKDQTIQFFPSIKSFSEQEGTPSLVILSGVLQNIPNPNQILQEIFFTAPDIVVLDRVPYNFEDKERITIQNVPPSIYIGRYPHRFFSKNHFMKLFSENNYTLVESFEAIDGSNTDGDWGGHIFIKSI